MNETVRKYMTLSVGVVVFGIILTHAKDFSTVVGTIGDTWTKQLNALKPGV